MSTPNFSKYNTRNYCVLLDENHTDDYVFMLQDLGYLAEECGFIHTSDYHCNMKMNVFAEQGDYENRYKTDLTEVEITTQIGVISGYYADATIDFDIEVRPTISGYRYRLSDYNCIFSMIQDILEDIEIEAKYGDEDWSFAIWRMNRKNVQKWLTNVITQIWDKCNEFCENNCDTRLICEGVFSNGEAVYAHAN